MIGSNFVYEDTRLKDLYTHLKRNKFEVYMPGIKHGDCLRPYLVVKNDAAIDIIGTTSHSQLYTVLCYVPKNRYSDLESLVTKVKTVMHNLKPLFMPTGLQTPSFYDDDIKAHMISIQYRNSRRDF